MSEGVTKENNIFLQVLQSTEALLLALLGSRDINYMGFCLFMLIPLIMTCSEIEQHSWKYEKKTKPDQTVGSSSARKHVKSVVIF